MRYELAADTDTSTLLLFDPGAIPETLDRRSLDEGGAMLESMDRAGLLCVFGRGGDGVQSLRIYLNEPMPDRLLGFAHHLRSIEDLPIPTGRFAFAGLEYAFRADNPLVRQHPHPGDSVTTEPGAYRLRLFQMSYPSDHLAEVFRAQAPVPELLAWESMKVLIPLSIAAWIGLVVIFFTNVRVPLPSLATPVLGLFFVLPFLVRQLEPYTSARDRFEQLARELPTFVAVLELVKLPEAAIVDFKST